MQGVPNKQKEKNGTMRAMWRGMESARKEIGIFGCLPVLRRAPVGRIQGAGLFQDGRVPVLYGFGLWKRNLPESGQAEEPDGGFVQRGGTDQAAFPAGVGGRQAVGESVRDSAETG